MDNHEIHDLKYSEVVTHQDYALLAWVHYIYIYLPKSKSSVSSFLAAEDN